MSSPSEFTSVPADTWRAIGELIGCDSMAVSVPVSVAGTKLEVTGIVARFGVGQFGQPEVAVQMPSSFGAGDLIVWFPVTQCSDWRWSR